jgi:vesicle coat complex subunit
MKALDKAGKSQKKKDVLKRILANMTMGNDMSSLFQQVIQCIAIPGIEVRKMIYLYIIHYAKSLPDLTILAVNILIKVINHCICFIP